MKEKAQKPSNQLSKAAGIHYHEYILAFRACHGRWWLAYPSNMFFFGLDKLFCNYVISCNVMRLVDHSRQLDMVSSWIGTFPLTRRSGRLVWSQLFACIFLFCSVQRGRAGNISDTKALQHCTKQLELASRIPSHCPKQLHVVVDRRSMLRTQTADNSGALSRIQSCHRLAISR